jgi:hypothetical protein
MEVYHGHTMAHSLTELIVHRAAPMGLPRPFLPEHDGESCVSNLKVNLYLIRCETNLDCMDLMGSCRTLTAGVVECRENRLRRV